VITFQPYLLNNATVSTYPSSLFSEHAASKWPLIAVLEESVADPNRGMPWVWIQIKRRHSSGS
jgi:hypothetical protein